MAGPERCPGELSARGGRGEAGAVLSPQKAEEQEPPVSFLEHHLGFEAGLWAGCMKCQY